MPVTDVKNALGLLAVLAGLSVQAVGAQPLAGADGLSGPDVVLESQLGLPGGDQSAAEAALELANMLDGAGGGISDETALAALEGAAAAGQPMALWRLGLMYESGEGVARDPVKAFGYFTQIANEHADAPPRGLDADIVAQSFVKVGDYYREGLPDAGIPADVRRSHALLLHAASYFGDADAQYRVGELYLDDNELGRNPLQGARWLSLAARKGHPAAQARLGDLMFHGEGMVPQPVEGLMWLTIAVETTRGTSDEPWIAALLDDAMRDATAEQKAEGKRAAATYGQQFAARQ